MRDRQADERQTDRQGQRENGNKRGETDRQADERQTDKEGEWEQEGRDRQTS